MWRRVLWSMVLVLGVACDVIEPVNPFDLETPPERQAPATLRGTVAISDASDDDARATTLSAIRIGVLDERGRRVSREGVEIAATLTDIDVVAEGLSTGSFQLPPLIPGSYTVVVDRAPAQYQAPTLPTVRLLPGADVDVGELRYTFVGGGDEGPGRIAGDVRTAGGAAGQHRVTLFRRSGNTTVLVRSVVTDGAFDFNALAFDDYAVVVESEGFTPVYRLGIEVEAQENGAARPQHQFSGDDALVVHPVTAALQPSLGDGTIILDEGIAYVRGDSAPLLVLPFVTRADLELGVTGMRLSTNASFLDASQQPIPFVPHQATTSVPLPQAEGPIQVFAQFEARSGDNAFAFVSPTVSMTLIRDTIPPAVVDLRAIGLPGDATGVRSPSRTINLAIDVSDATSAVDAVGVAFDVEPALLDDVTATPGLQRVARSLTADADGEREIVVVVEDRAGNRSAPVRLPVTIDTVAPDVALAVVGADDGFLRSRVATVDVATLIPDDDDVLVAVGLEGDVNELDVGPLGRTELVLPANLGHGAPVTFQAVAFDVVGNRTSVTRTVTLDLRGSVSGAVISDAVPGVIDSVAGAVVTLSDARGTVVGGPTTVDASGDFLFPGVIEGRGYTVRVALAGHQDAVARNVAVDVDAAVDLGDVVLALARAELRGRALRSDVVADATAHAGIAVTATLVSPTRGFSETVVSDAAGNWTLRGVPRTLTGETFTLSAQATEYGSASAEVLVTDAVVIAPDLLLPRGRGDFDVCRTADAGCTPAQFFSANTVDIRLRDATDVVAIHVSLNGGVSERLPLGAGNRTTVSLAALADGEVVVSVQSEETDGSRSEVLSTTIIRDTVPPLAASIIRRANPTARDPRFTNAGFVDVIVDADAGVGAVAPLGTARVVLADAAPPLPAAGFVACTHEVSCRVTLPTVERLQRVFAFSCDAAGNCAAPVETFIIRDTTPPTRANGAAFRVAATGSVVDGNTTILASPFYSGVIDTGAARTLGGTAVVDDAGGAVAEVFAFRFSLAQANLQNVAIQSFIDPPRAGETRDGADIVVPPLPAGDGARTVFAQFVDAAGNVSQEQIAVELIVDTIGPIALITLNGGQPTNQLSVPVVLTVPAGAEAPVRVELTVDDGAAQVFPVPFVGTEQLLLPPVDGLRRVVVNAFDRVGNVNRSDLSILLDRAGPRIDAARCTTSTCTDAGFGELLSRAADARIDLAVTAVDALSLVTAVEVATTPALPGGPQLVTLVGGTLAGVQVPANVSSTLSLVPIDAVGNRGEAFVRAVRHDITPPVIASIAIAGGAARTNALQVPVRIEVPAGDAVELRLAPTTAFSGPFSVFRADEFFTFAGADGERQVCAEVRDAAGNAASACDTIQLDRTPPTGTVSVVSAVVSTATTTATLSYPADTTQVVASTASLTCDPATTPYVTATGSPQNITVALDGVDGTRTIFACFRDEAGNVAQATTTITVDRTAPTVSLILNDGASFATTTTPTARITASADANALAIAVDSALDCASASYGAFSTSPTVTLPSSQGLHTVRACVRDAAGNVSAEPAVATITLDTIRPSTSVLINGGAAFATSTAATVTLAASADTVAMAIANAASLDCATASYTTFQPTVAHQLTGGDGSKIVSVCVRDAAGQVSAASASDTIVVDTTAPTGVLTVAGGAETTAIATVSAVLSGQSADIAFVAVTASPIACDTAPFQPLGGVTTFEVTLPLPNTVNVVTACLRDGAGNIGAITDSIFFENAAGDALVVAINGGAATTRSRDVTVALFRPSTEFDQMKVVEAPTLDCADLSGYEAFNGTKALSLSSGAAPAEGQRTVSACVRSTTSSLTRAASDTIFLDTFAPDGTIVIDGGAVTSSATVTATLSNAFAADGEVITVALSETSTVGGGGLCTGSFEAFSAARTFTFTGGDGTRTLFACLRDAAGNTREVSDVVILDRAPPSPVAITVPALTTSTTINVGLLFPADAVQVALGEGALDCLTTQGYVAVPGGASPSLPLTLSAADGTRAIAACFRDAAGNTSQATATTTLDRTSPSGTVVIDGGAAFSTDLVVSVAIQNATDAVRMARVESAAPINCATQSYVAFVSPLDFTLAAGEGTRTIQVCLEDAAGNRALALADSIVVDTIAPNGSVSINDGAVATNSRTVTLGVGTGVHTDVVAFAAAETSITCNAANLLYSPFAPTVPFVLSSTEGTRTVQLCLRDQAGNVSSVAASDTIVLDTAAPVGGAVAINDGDGFLNGEATIGLTVSWASAGDVAAIKVGEGAVDCQSSSGYTTVGQAATSASVPAFAVSSGDGTKLVLACLRDAAGNVATAQDTTVRDTTAPVVSAVVCPDCVVDAGAVFSRTANVTLAVSADETGSGLASARVAVDAGAEVALPLVNGAVTVSALAEGARTLRVKLVDRAGNVSAVSRDIVVTVDLTAPTLAQLLLNGSNGAGNATSSRTVAVGIVGASADVAQMAVVEGNGAVAQIASCALATYAPFVPEFTRTLPSVDGAKAVSVCLRDRAGNVTATPTTTTITLDTVPVSLPATPVVVLDGDGFLQAETTISVRLNWTTNGDAREAKIQEGIVDCASSSGYVALPVNANTFDIPGVPASAADGTKTFGVCFKDIAGNIVVAQGSTVRDATAPVVTAVACPACTLDNGTLFARSTSVTLLASSIEGGSGVASARVSRNGGALTTFPVTAGQFTVTGLAQGANTLLVKLADVAGNISGDAVDVELAVTVDTTPPNLAAGSLRLNGLSAGGATNNSLVTAAIAGAPVDVAGLFIVEAASAPNCAAATYGPFALTSSLQLSSGDGSKTVFACLRDRAGNTSTSAVSASITLDTLVPSLPATPVTILDGGDDFLTSVAGGVSVRLNWNTIGDVVAVKVGENAVDCGSEPYDRPTGIATVNTVTLPNVPLSAVDGTKVVAACFKDAAGNISTAQDSTTLDQAGPNGAITINNGATFTTDASENITVVARMATDTARFAVVETTNPGCTTPTLTCATATYESFTAVAVDGVLQASKVLNFSGAAAAPEGAKCVEACFEDAAGNRTASASLAGITFDKTAPTVAAGNVTLTGTPAGATTRTAQITVAVAGAPADTATYRISEDSTFAGNTQAFVPFTATAQPFLLSAGDGTKNVFVQLRDAAGNVGTATQRTITLDATAPEAASVVINGGDAFAASTSVTLTLTATGATEMQIAVDGVPDTEPFVAFATSAAATLLAPDGNKLVAVRFRDAAGNSTIATDGIVLDRVAPAGGAVVINDGAIVTNNTTVTLAITPPTDAATMSIAGGPFVAVSTVALTAISAGDCTPGDLCKSVAVVFRDAAGNSGTPVVDTIGLDTVPPSSVSVALSSSATADTSGFTTTGTVTASFGFATTAGNAVAVKHGEGAVDCATPAGYVALGATSPFTVGGIALSSGDGQKNYVACFRDAAGNVSSAATSITADRTRPFGAIAINGGAATTTATGVTIAVTPAADDVTRVAFVNASTAPTCSSLANGAFADITPTMAHTLTSGDGAKTVFACFRDVAGNSSTLPVSASITLDGTAPSLAFSLIGNSTAQAGQTNTRTITVQITSLSSDTTQLAFGETSLACATAPYEPIAQPVVVPLARTFILADGSDGTRTVAVCARDGAGNVSTSTTRTINLDATAPQVAVSLNSGATFATSTTATATLTPTPAGDPLRRFVSSDPTIDCAQVPDAAYVGATFAALPASVTATLTSGDGEKFVAICFKDAAGNIARFGDSITLDTTRPTAAFVVDGGATFSLDTTVTADFSLVSSDVTQMAVSRTAIADCGSATFTAFANNSNVVGLVEGTNTISACLRDAAGNISDANPVVAGLQPFTDLIVVDTQNPTLSSFVIGPVGGAAPDPGFVPSVDVVVRVNASALSSDVVALAIGNTSLDCGTASYALMPQPLPTTLTTNHTLTAGADGSRSVVICVKDGAGRTGSQSANTTLDTTPPQLASFILNGGAAVTGAATVSVGMESSPSNDVLRFTLTSNTTADCAQAPFSGAFATLPATAAATLASGDGNRSVLGCFQDRAGNVAAAIDDIVLDTTFPLPVPAPCTSCNVIRDIAFVGDLSLIAAPISLEADVVSARTVLSNDFTQSDRACTSDAQCRPSEQCLLFPADPNGTTFALRCVEQQPDPTTIVVTLNNAGAPLATMPIEGEQFWAIAYIDAAGNMSPPARASAHRDVTVPIINFSLNTTITNQRTVFVRDLTVSGERGVPEAGRMGTFQASVLPTFADAPELPFSVFGNPATLTDAIPVALGASDGSQTVRVRFVDNVGNVQGFGSVDTATVILDTAVPGTPRFADGSVSIRASDAVAFSPLATQSVDEGAGLASPPYVLRGFRTAVAGLSCATTSEGVVCAWDGTTAFNAPSTAFFEGESRIRITARDLAGNVSAEDLRLVTRDTVVPSSIRMVSALSGDERVNLSWAKPVSGADDVVGFLIDYQPATSTSCPTSAASFPYAGTLADQGDSPVDVGSNTSFALTGLPNGSPLCVAVRGYDAAGNISAANNGSVRLVTPAEVPLVPASVVDLRMSTHLGLNTTDHVGAIAVRRNMLYVAAKNRGLIEFDATNLAGCLEAGGGSSTFIPCVDGVRISSAGVLTNPRDMVLHGKMAFVAEFSTGATGGVHVYTIDEGTAPSAVSQIALRNVMDIDVVGSRLYALYQPTNGTRAIDIYDIGPLYNVALGVPTLLATIGSATAPTDTQIFNNSDGIDVQASLLAVTGGTEGTASAGRIFNVNTTTGAVTRRPGTTSGDFSGRSIIVMGDRLINVTNSNVALYRDLDQSATPLDQPAASAIGARLVAYGPYLFSTGSGRLDVFDLSGEDIRLVSQHSQSVSGGSNNLGPIAVDNGRVYYANGGADTITTLDLFHGVAMQPIAEIGQSRGGAAAAMLDGHLFNGMQTSGYADRDGFTITGQFTDATQLRTEVDGSMLTWAKIEGFIPSPQTFVIEAGTHSTEEGVLAFGLSTGVAGTARVEESVLTGGTATMAWPWLLVAGRDPATGDIVVRRYDLRNPGNAPTVRTMLAASNVGCNVQPSGITVHRGFVWVVVTEPLTNGGGCGGLYRATLNRPGTFGAAAKVLNSNAIHGVSWLGTRTLTWGNNGDLNIYHYTSGDTFSDPANRTTLTGVPMPPSTLGGMEPVFAGPHLLSADFSNLHYGRLDFPDGGPHADALTRISSFSAGAGEPRQVILAGDTIYLQRNLRLMQVLRLR
jgi:hypothetical protein